MTWPDGPEVSMSLVKGVIIVIVLGIVLAVLAVLLHLPSILLWLGVVLIVAGIVLNLVPIGGRTRRWY